MKLAIHSHRHADSLLQSQYPHLWDEIIRVFSMAPVFIYPGKSRVHSRNLVVQQVLNTFFELMLAVHLDWEPQPAISDVPGQEFRADFKKRFGAPAAFRQLWMEIQFGNSARFDSDMVKFQIAHAAGNLGMALSIVPMQMMASRIDKNVANYERALATLQGLGPKIDFPMLLIGLEPDGDTPIVDISECQFKSLNEITGRKSFRNRIRIIEGYLNGIPMSEIGPYSPTGALLGDQRQAFLN